MWNWVFFVTLLAVFANVNSAGAGAARLVCYSEGSRTDGFTECTHLVYTGDARGDKLEGLLKEYRKSNPRLKIILRISEDDEDLRGLVKSKHVQGLEVYDAHKALDRSKVLEKVEAARTAITAAGGGPLFLALPAHPELLAKYYDLRALMKKADLMMVQTHALGEVKKMTFHPSRLSGLWDMMNTDSVVDLVVGLGVPASKIVISLPATVRKFQLLNETLSTPGSPTTEDYPKEIDQAELCRLLQKGRWTLERDQDLSAPYAFQDKTWMSFEDSSSVDVKGKYARVRGLAGLALQSADKDVDTPCGPTLKTALAKVLNQQSRAPRAAVLRSLEHEILSAPGHAQQLDALQVSPYRITQVVDSDGVIHSIREDTRTEFSCSRQGYFVHPRSCARFYRCVKFDQLSPEFTVFEFDCPAGLAFDSRYEVCVWPGSLPHSQACPGSSEIAPVPQTRFVCPEHEGYYADPENCRWFFACLDHGKAPLTAYEFRCPFGLGFDAEKLKCDWPWLVPACGNIGRYEAEAFGFGGAALTGATGFQGQTADAINIAAHQSLISGASLNNHVGIQNGFLSHADALDSNFIASQELANAGHDFQIAHGVGNGVALSGVNAGLVQPAKYSSGSIILDDYRLPTKGESAHGLDLQHSTGSQGGLGFQNGQYSTVGSFVQQSTQNGQHSSLGSLEQQNSGLQNSHYNTLGSLEQQNGQHSSFDSFGQQKSHQYRNSDYDAINSGAYIHDPTGDHAEPYNHEDAPAVPYIHDDSPSPPYVHTSHKSNDYNDGRYSGSQDHSSQGKYTHDNSGAYVGQGLSNNGYFGSYNADHSGIYAHDNSADYEAGVYRADGHIGEGERSSTNINIHHGSYGNGNGAYLADTKAFTGASHTLTAGAINVGLVGKTTLVDTGYNDQFNYNAGSHSFGHQVLHQYNNQHNNGHLPIIKEAGVSINHIGTDGNNLDGYSFVTTPTSSGIPTTATPFAVTTSIPVTTYKTTYVPEAPKTDIKQIFGYSQPAVTFVQPTISTVKQYITPSVEVTDYNQGANYQATNTKSQSEASGYIYSKPNIKFEEGVTQTTPTPIVVSTFRPQGFSHSQQTVHKLENSGYQYSTPVPVTEEPFKKIVAYTTGPELTYSQPTVVSYSPQSFSHQTVHKINTGNTDAGSIASGYDYSKSSFTYEQPQSYVEHTTAQPAVVSKYKPQGFGFSHNTVHKVDVNHINAYDSGYKYDKPSSGYEYSKPEIKFEETPKTFIQYTTSPPAVSSYQPQTYSHSVVHKTQNYIPVSSTAAPQLELTYHQPAVSVYLNPILKYVENVTPVSPVTYIQPTGQSFSHHTIHKVESNNYYSPVNVDTGYKYDAPKTVVEYTTAHPVVTNVQPTGQSFSHHTIHKVESNNYYSPVNVDTGYKYDAPKNVVEYTTAQPVVTTTYRPQISNQVHKVEASKVNSYANSETGYHYEQPAVKFEETPVVQYTTTAPAVSTYQPHTFSHQTFHTYDTQKYTPFSTVTPKIYQQEAVSVYENPILKFTTQNVTPAPKYIPAIQQHKINHVYNQNSYSYNQPEIQRESLQTLNAAKAYSDASLVSHQTYHQYDTKRNEAGNNIVFVSTTPSNLIYEDHYSAYESPKYKAPEYVLPKSYTVSTVAPSQNTLVKQTDQYDYKPIDYSRGTSSLSQVSFSTSHVEQPKNVESVHFSSVPEIQIDYQGNDYSLPKAENAYLQPSSTVRPIVTSTYKPVYSTTLKYLPPPESTPTDQPDYTVKQYLPPKVDYTYSIPSTTAQPRPRPTTKAPEYLPPVDQGNVVNFESFGYKSQDTNFQINPYQYTVSSTPKTNLLGFGTVGPDAGLVSQVTYSTGVPISSTYLPPVTSTYKPQVTATYLPPVVSSTYSPPTVTPTYLPARKSRPRVRPTTKAPEYLPPIETTTFKAPEYLPPVDQSYINFGLKNAQVSVNPYRADQTVVPIQRKQNIVVQTAKSNQLGFGTAGSDAGLVSEVTYSTSAPLVSSTDSYTISTKSSSAADDIGEVIPVVTRRNKPKVAVVTKINDFNPLLVRKLGAVCSCQSPIVVLRGRRPNVKVQDYEDYTDESDYNDGRGDVSDNNWALKSERLISNTVTPISVTKSTFNPIIVPDDSYYQDIQDSSIEISPKTNNIYSEEFVSSTPVYSTTQKVVKIRPRVKAVTAAPNYKTVVLNQEVAPNVVIKDTVRGRDSLPDCQRAGLFRHPTQCNKFYACRWDCNKQKFTVYTFNCPIQLSFDPTLGACNWPSQGPSCQGNTLLTNTL